MPFEDAEASSGLDVPEADVPGAGEGAALIGGPGDHVNMVGMAFEHADAAAIRQVPHPDGPVPGTGEGAPVVGIEGHTVDTVRMTVKDVERLTRLRVQEANARVGR